MQCGASLLSDNFWAVHLWLAIRMRRGYLHLMRATHDSLGPPSLLDAACPRTRYSYCKPICM